MLRFQKIEIEFTDEGRIRATARVTADDYADIVGQHEGFNLASPETAYNRDLLSSYGRTVGRRSIEAEATFYQNAFARSGPWDLVFTAPTGRPVRVTIDAGDAESQPDSFGDHLFEQWLRRILGGANLDAATVERLAAVIAKEAAEERHDLRRLREAFAV